MIKTSKHSIQYSNSGKLNSYTDLISEFRNVAQIIVDDIWTNGYVWSDNTGEHMFSISNNQLSFPSFIDYNRFKLDTFLSARALSSIATQVAGMIKAETEKQRKRLYILNKVKSEGASKKQRRLLGRKLKQNIPVKPNCSNFRPELSSKCTEFIDYNGEFDAFIKLKSITNVRGFEIIIPIKYHKHSNKLKSKGERMNSFSFGSNSVDVRWEIKEPDLKTLGDVLGADQGFKDVLTLSNNTKTPKTDKHNHTLESICEKLSRKKKGSKAFKRTQDHREQFINWSINQLDLSNVKQINLEDVWNIGYKSNTSRILSHWTNTLIRDKVESVCEEQGVLVIHQSSTYRSQRCSECGLVRKANRKGKIYSCKYCGCEIDSDLNAARNHEVVLPEIPWTLQKMNKNRGNGFFWKPTGFFDMNGGILEYPLPSKSIIDIK